MGSPPGAMSLPTTGANLEALRKGDWKLHYFKIGWAPDGADNNVSAELYNLREDVGESRNLYEEHPELVAEIEIEAEKFRQALGDR